MVGLSISPNFAEDQTLATSSYLNGVKVSTDGGDTWQPQNTGLAAEFEWTRAPDYFLRIFNVLFSPDYANEEDMFNRTLGFFLQ